MCTKKKPITIKGNPNVHKDATWACEHEQGSMIESFKKYSSHLDMIF
jgi:hypothetical protein